MSSVAIGQNPCLKESAEVRLPGRCTFRDLPLSGGTFGLRKEDSAWDRVEFFCLMLSLRIGCAWALNSLVLFQTLALALEKGVSLALKKRTLERRVPRTPQVVAISFRHTNSQGLSLVQKDATLRVLFTAFLFGEVIIVDNSTVTCF